MATFIYSLCQNVYKNIIYVSAVRNANKKIGINYFFKQLFTISNSKKITNFNNHYDNVITLKHFKFGLKTTNCLLARHDYVINKNILRYFQSMRNFSSNAPEPEPEPPKRSLPPLMDFPEIIWPSVLKSIRNWILSSLIIIPYFDREFSLHDFVIGSKKALEVVSNNLASGNFKDLSGLVTEDALAILSRTVSSLSLAQRQQLAIDSRDIYFSFPYQVGIMFDESDTNQKRFVEITMVYHVLHGLHLMRERGEEPSMNVGMLPEFRDKIYICNYRFIREFTKDVEDQWTINLINHFKPSDFV